jgi:hypothetical protein
MEKIDLQLFEGLELSHGELDRARRRCFMAGLLIGAGVGLLLGLAAGRAL